MSVRAENLQYYQPRKYPGQNTPAMKKRLMDAFEDGRKYERELLRGVIDQALR